MKIALVGCGALTKTFYQPVLHRLGIKPFALVDPSLDRIKKLAEDWGAEKVAASPEEIADLADAAIIASPNFLHASQAKVFLEKGKHVLLEKPMTVSSAEGLSLVKTAETSGAVLQIAMMRRFWKLNKAVKKMLEEKSLGKIKEVSMLEGGVLNWPAQSLALFDKKQSLGGTLIDTGSHTLDLLCWWMQDEPAEIRYSDDDSGGVETDCTLNFIFKQSGIKTKVELTRIRNMPNEYRITGDKGWLMIKPFGNMFTASDSKISKQVNAVYSDLELRTQTIHDVFDEQVNTWINCISSGQASPVNAASVLPSIQLIETCYNNRKRKIYPWEELTA
jgi:predicted dehydrogenase